MTGRHANAMKAYLDEIGAAYEEYLLKGALRYLQKKEDPELFYEIYKEQPTTIFDTFFEVVEVPIDKKEKVEEKVKEVKEDKFAAIIKDIKIKESIVKGHFTAIETAYTACMNIIESDAKEQFIKLGGYVTQIDKDKGQIVNILISVESTVGEYKRAIVELERKLLDKPDEVVSKELESTKKFIEESNKYIDTIRRYRNAAVLPENVIRAFQNLHPEKRGKLARKQTFDELKEKYNFAVRLISDPSLKPKKVVEEEEEEDEEYEEEEEEEETNADTASVGSGTASVAGNSSLPTVAPRPHTRPLTKAEQRAKDAANAAVGRAIKAAAQTTAAQPTQTRPVRQRRARLSKTAEAEAEANAAAKGKRKTRKSRKSI
jgi:hypothetical protein